MNFYWGIVGFNIVLAIANTVLLFCLQRQLGVVNRLLEETKHNLQISKAVLGHTKRQSEQSEL